MFLSLFMLFMWFFFSVAAQPYIELWEEEEENYIKILSAKIFICSGSDGALLPTMNDDV
jgi:hypothetical protein